LIKEIELYTDGACSGNPGPGGWAALLRYSSDLGAHEKNIHEKIVSGSDQATTNNRMELQAVIGGLSELKSSCRVTVYTDSQYVCRGMTEWLSNWKKKGWVNSQKEPVKNKDLWLILDQLAAKHTLVWTWVRGHSGHPENEKVDAIARQEIEQLQARR
jgi:ribonuclease HI